MSRFSSILVGVDLSHGDWIASDVGETPSHFACEQAIELAVASAKSGGVAPSVHFCAVLDVDERTKRHVTEVVEGETTCVTQAADALRLQVEQASSQGVRATSSVVLGHSRVELVKKAHDEGHDLVMVGSKGHGLLGGMLTGSTSLSLISRCHCPVWVVKPHAPGSLHRILVSTDFSPVCERLLQYGIELAKSLAAELHVMHVVEQQPRPFFGARTAADGTSKVPRHETTALARERLEALAQRSDVADLPKPLVTHLAEGVAGTVVVRQTQALEIDLLLFGTVAWYGLPGLLIGSTAQRILPDLKCSLLTIQPDDNIAR